ncbi:hypothetical protein PT974_01826 [Cladobotryum mycophilum]|uniref:LAMTOR1 n=1 Tax=Cladobotryum mycophilum TaxID=491253 RepID=A0ABR0SWE1_9HYPO
MCYFEQTRWECGYWRWGHFRQQCNKEYRMGETCGLKLVYETRIEAGVCKLCQDTDKKRRRLLKMQQDLARWKQEGNRSATIEKTEAEQAEVTEQVNRMLEEHQLRLKSLGQVRENFPFCLWDNETRRDESEQNRLQKDETKAPEA